MPSIISLRQPLGRSDLNKPPFTLWVLRSKLFVFRLLSQFLSHICFVFFLIWSCLQFPTFATFALLQNSFGTSLLRLAVPYFCHFCTTTMHNNYAQLLWNSAPEACSSLFLPLLHNNYAQLQWNPTPEACSSLFLLLLHNNYAQLQWNPAPEACSSLFLLLLHNNYAQLQWNPAPEACSSLFCHFYTITMEPPQIKIKIVRSILTFICRNQYDSICNVPFDWFCLNYFVEQTKWEQFSLNCSAGRVLSDRGHWPQSSSSMGLAEAPGLKSNCSLTFELLIAIHSLVEWLFIATFNWNFNFLHDCS